MFEFPSGRTSTVFVAQLLYPWPLLLLVAVKATFCEPCRTVSETRVELRRASETETAVTPAALAMSCNVTRWLDLAGAGVWAAAGVWYN